METYAPTALYALLTLTGTLVSIVAGTIDRLVPIPTPRLAMQVTKQRQRLMDFCSVVFFVVWSHIPASMLAATTEVTWNDGVVFMTWRVFDWQEWWHLAALVAVSYAFLKLLRLAGGRRRA